MPKPRSPLKIDPKWSPPRRLERYEPPRELERHIRKYWAGLHRIHVCPVIGRRSPALYKLTLRCAGPSDAPEGIEMDHVARLITSMVAQFSARRTGPVPFVVITWQARGQNGGRATKHQCSFEWPGGPAALHRGEERVPIRSAPGDEDEGEEGEEGARGDGEDDEVEQDGDGDGDDQEDAEEEEEDDEGEEEDEEDQEDDEMDESDHPSDTYRPHRQYAARPAPYRDHRPSPVPQPQHGAPAAYAPNGVPYGGAPGQWQQPAAPAPPPHGGPYMQPHMAPYPAPGGMGPVPPPVHDHYSGLIQHTLLIMREQRHEVRQANEARWRADERLYEMMRVQRGETEYFRKALERQYEQRGEVYDEAYRAIRMTADWKDKVMSLEYEKEAIRKDAEVAAQNRGGHSPVLQGAALLGPMAINALAAMVHALKGKEGDPPTIITPELMQIIAGAAMGGGAAPMPGMDPGAVYQMGPGMGDVVPGPLPMPGPIPADGLPPGVPMHQAHVGVAPPMPPEASPAPGAPVGVPPPPPPGPPMGAAGSRLVGPAPSVPPATPQAVAAQQYVERNPVCAAAQVLLHESTPDVHARISQGVARELWACIQNLWGAPGDSTAAIYIRQIAERIRDDAQVAALCSQLQPQHVPLLMHLVTVLEQSPWSGIATRSSGTITETNGGIPADPATSPASSWAKNNGASSTDETSRTSSEQSSESRRMKREKNRNRGRNRSPKRS